MSFLNIVLVKAGIFNIHKMLITILKTAFLKLNPKEWSIETIKTLTGTNSTENWKQLLMKTLI